MLAVCLVLAINRLLKCIGVAIKCIVIGGKFFVVIILAKQAKNVGSCRKISKHIKINLV